MTKEELFDSIADELLQDYDASEEGAERIFSVGGRYEVKIQFEEDGFCYVWVNDTYRFTYDYCNKSVVIEQDPTGLLQGIEKVFVPRFGKEVSIRPLKWCPKCESRVQINTNPEHPQPYYCPECKEYWFDMDADD